MQTEIDPFLRDTILLLAAKRTMLRKDKDNIDTLVIGSSHGDFGFNPFYYPKSFNLCFRSQDLKHSFHLLEKISSDHPKIRNIILFYSIFSPGSFMEKSPSEKVISPSMNEIFGLNLDYEDESLKSIAEKIKGELDDISVDIEGVRGFFPESAKGVISDSYGVKRRADEHLKLNKITDANIYLTKILDLTAKQKQRVCVVIPPARSDYKEATGGDSKLLFKSLFDLLNSRSESEEISVINCFDDAKFIDAHFCDYDHLLPLGAGTDLLTKLVLNKMGAAPSGYFSNTVQIQSSALPLTGMNLLNSSFRINSQITPPGHPSFGLDKSK